ncbi:O-antigen ligase [Vibrio crassostreae]|uniref:O-antigen ligase family protein n=1 Tax=Vibrio crassostreae TaxID=246167 RepID=UPI000F4A4411|nr:O-antigen ligase family protein [Vibrio crassostreae]ROR17282.1 O-antigen ligase [Vibrio crassostreae]TCN76779.1 O-antigen ligase [Vibrio crassostreae]TCV26824.1 O-antigen ligase [Vibrio crassostreae]TWD36585.1 O-antigen ligase [Vibrio crassostreae]TWD66885.1 O-antigen ligase [Vibrio crassostreae]
MNIINRKQIYTALLLLPYFFAVTGMLVLDSGDKKMIPLFLISIIVSILVFKKETILKNIRYPFMWLIVTSCLYAIFSYYYHGASSREIRALIGATLFLLVFPYKFLTKKLIRWIILVGGFAICFNSIYFNVYMGVERDAGYINPIPYATTSALLAIVALSLLMDKSNFKHHAVSFLAFILYLPPIILSEARGVWLALLLSFLIIIVIRFINTPPSKSKVLLSLLTTISLLSISSIIFKDKINHRYEHTIYEINNIKSGNYDTSIGWRIQLWELAPEIYIQSPIIGQGHGDNYEKILNKKLETNAISHYIYYYASSHYHNQIIDKLVKSGAIGLILLVGLLAYPVLTLKYLVDYEKFIVIGSTSLFFIAGLTDVPFNHPQPLMLYLLFLVPICSRCKRVTND